MLTRRSDFFLTLAARSIADAVRKETGEIVLSAAQHGIEEVAERGDLTVEERQAILADNARRVFNL
jgi:hypothetical protein